MEMDNELFKKDFGVCTYCKNEKYLMYKEDKGESCTDCHQSHHDRSALKARHPNEVLRKTVLAQAGVKEEEIVE